MASTVPWWERSVGKHTDSAVCFCFASLCVASCHCEVCYRDLFSKSTDKFCTHHKICRLSLFPVDDSTRFHMVGSTWFNSWSSRWVLLKVDLTELFQQKWLRGFEFACSFGVNLDLLKIHVSGSPTHFVRQMVWGEKFRGLLSHQEKTHTHKITVWEKIWGRSEVACRRNIWIQKTMRTGFLPGWRKKWVWCVRVWFISIQG